MYLKHGEYISLDRKSSLFLGYGIPLPLERVTGDGAVILSLIPINS